jgi:hypothetical protein
MQELFGEPISVYTRAQALEDGVLVDVTETAKQAGFTFPVAVTRTLWGRYIDPSEKAKGYGQSAAGRLWDVLWMARLAAQRQAGERIEFSVIFQDGPHPRDKHQPTLFGRCGPGDRAEPVVTIMLPEDD